MSWKLAEWRWREQVSLRGRSQRKIWDIEDAIKNGDVVEEAVRLAYHFPDRADDCWQSRMETPRGRRLGLIRSKMNSHSPPRIEVPQLPLQHHNSYHPSRSSSAPLLITSKESCLASGGPNLTSSSFSPLLSESTSSTTEVCATPRTPQLATDFLKSQDWNHLAIDQEIDKQTAVEQLNSSFGLSRRPSQAANMHRLTSCFGRPQDPPEETDDQQNNRTGTISRRTISNPVNFQHRETGGHTNHAPSIELPSTPPQPGSASPALYQTLSQQRAINYLRVTQRPYLTSERPATAPFPGSSGPQFLTPTRRRLPHRIAVEITPEADFLLRDDQAIELGRRPSHDIVQGDRVFIRNSLSFFDLDREYRRDGDLSVQHLDPRVQDHTASIASGTGAGVIGTYSNVRPRRAGHVRVRNSRDIIGIAISGDDNYSQNAAGIVDATMPAPVFRLLRQNGPVGDVPQGSLPPIPPRVSSLEYRRFHVPSSEVAQYENTQSLLKAGVYEHVDVAKGSQGQTHETETAFSSYLSDDPAVTHDLGEPGPAVYNDDDDSACDWVLYGPFQPEYRLRGLSQLDTGSKELLVSATPAYHNVLRNGHAVGYYDPGMRSLNNDVHGLEESAEQDLNSSNLLEEEEPRILTVRIITQDNGDIFEQEKCFPGNLGSGVWFGRGRNEESDKDSKRKPFFQAKDDRDCEIIRDRELQFKSHLPSQATIQPHVEPHVTDPSPDPSNSSLATKPLLPTNNNNTDPSPDPPGSSLAKTSTSDNMSTTQEEPATPWDPILEESALTHSAIGIAITTDVAVQGFRQHLSDDESVYSLTHDSIIQDEAMDSGVAISTDAGLIEDLPDAEFVDSTTSNSAFQDESVDQGAVSEPRSVNVAEDRATAGIPASDEMDLRDVIVEGEQAEVIEMTNMAIGRDFSIGTMGTVPTSSQVHSDHDRYNHNGSSLPSDRSFDYADDAFVSAYLRGTNPILRNIHPIARRGVPVRSQETAREWSIRPALRPRPLPAVEERERKEAGRKVVWKLSCVPLLGWVILYYLWKDEPAMGGLDRPLMRWQTRNLFWEMGKEEKELAGRVLLGVSVVVVAAWAVLCAVLVCIEFL